MRDAYKYPVHDGWGSMTWAQVDRRVKTLAACLLDTGIQPGDRVAIMSSARVEWPVAAFAILTAGASVVAIYPETSPEGVDYILKDSGCSALFVENQQRLDVVLASGEFARGLPTIVIDANTNEEHLSWHAMTNPSREARNRLAQINADTASDTLATLIYTSGTTSKPKGVMLTHGNWVAEALAIDETGIAKQDDIEYYWLPFAHSFGMALMFGHVAIGFLKFIDGDPKHVVQNLKDIRPTFVGGPPRTFEKIAAGVTLRMSTASRSTRMLYELAMRSARKRLDHRNRSGAPYRLQRFGIAPIVFKKLSKSFGGRLRFFISGGAALSPEIGDLFDLWGVPILQGYGLSETCGASTVARYDHHPTGSVGWPLPGTDLKIAEPLDGNPHGEILLKGPHVMAGYFGDRRATRQAIDAEGWFHTGDLGRIDYSSPDRPTLYVTGRLKVSCKLSNGKYVAPEQIEVALTATGYIAHAVVIAEGRKFVSALVSLDPDNLQQLAQTLGIKGDYQTLATHRAVQAKIQELVDQVNQKFEHWERIVKMAIVPEVFTTDNGYLTPSNKPIRHQVLSDYGDLVEALYAS